jgi:uncharacterized protein (DUF2336 family)
MAIHEDPAVRRDLAARSDVMPEILFYLSGDPSPEVRQAIAGNLATPRRADLKLAEDTDDSVRSRLAGKISGVLPDLTVEEAEALGDLTYQALDLLARDQVTRVRRIIADALKDVADAPSDVINHLARDAEIVVAGPILENSPVLTDSDLLDIVSDGPMKGALASIANRKAIGATVADAVARTGDVEAVGVLLENPNAQIREDTLDYIIERAPGIEEWHSPLVHRHELPGGAAVRIAEFVADRLLQALVKREDFDTATATALRNVVHQRLNPEQKEAPSSPGPAKKIVPAAADAEEEIRQVWEQAIAEAGSPLDAALSLYQAKKLGARIVLDALTSGNDEFVMAALAVMGEVPFSVAERIVATQSAKGIIALAWRANIPERMVAQLQTKLCRIPPDEILKPPRIGEWPLSEDEMVWQLEFFYQLAMKT